MYHFSWNSLVTISVDRVDFYHFSQQSRFLPFQPTEEIFTIPFSFQLYAFTSMAVVILSTVVFILSTMPEVFPNTQTLILLHIYQYSHTILTILNTLNNAWGLNISTTIQRQRFHVSFLFQVVSITISPISTTSMLIHQHQHLARMWYHHS